MTIQEYLDKINIRYKSGITTEHSFRGDLQNLLESILPDVLVTNEPTRIKCGAPDYILTKKDIPLGYIEAKDLGADLNSKSYQEQFSRYKESLNNLIITNYLDFQVFKDGCLVATYSIADKQANNIHPKPEQFEALKVHIIDFAIPVGQTIKSSQKLAIMMASKAKMLAQIIEAALISDEENTENSTLKEQMKAFQDILIHDIKPKEFADIYAQTIAYGMFAARLHDPTLPTFSRIEAAELIPKSNPFLRKLFQYIAGYDLDVRIVWIVDALADIFRATDVAALLKNFGKSTQQHDPIIHFYETFLAEYDPKLRKARGVWYTPEPVVKFIVRAVDDILKTEFGLADGLADTSKVKIKTTVQTKATSDARSKLKDVEMEQEVHRVQILDPATGTATFLAEVVKYIYEGKFEGQQGIWSNYVDNHLIPRLNGFELLMASYAMAHLKLDLLLNETGYKAKKEQRLKIYLTNSLEEYHPDTGTLFANWLSSEANEANQIKRDSPVMVVIGNPPYSVSSSNKSKWIEGLLSAYKRNLNEKNIQPLSDDYIKFIRLGEYFIQKNGEGVLAYISNNSFLDGLIHRRMRESLLTTFDSMYILDLHGDSKKREKAPDGSKDKNVFDIMQGVSINIFVKKINESKLKATLFHYDLFGTRADKYDFLLNNSIDTILWQTVETHEPQFFFKYKDLRNKPEYENFLSLTKIFKEYNSGVQTEFDELSIADDEETLEKTIQLLKTRGVTEIIHTLKLPESSVSKVSNAKADIEKNPYKIVNYNFRIFDTRKAIYTGCSNGVMGRPRGKTMQHLLQPNIALIAPKQTYYGFKHSFISKDICDANLIASAKKFGCGSVFPLYLYSSTSQKTIDAHYDKSLNIDAEFLKQVAGNTGLSFTEQSSSADGTFSGIDVFDYIYAVLHSPGYRTTFNEFLKVDFPRVPVPKSSACFLKLIAFGGELRKIHLMESNVLNRLTTKYPMSGNNEVRIIEYTESKLWINETQYFENVPLVAFEFYIGSYQPAQKWLKDRKGRQLSFEDIQHYQKIIVALTETDRIMKEIDKIDFM